MKVKMTFSLMLILLVLSLPLTVVADSDPPLPFLPNKGGSEESKTMRDTAQLIGDDINEYAPEMGVILSVIFAAMFLIGIIRLSYALITKTGFVLKGATGMLIIVPIFFLLVRLFFIIAFTTSRPSVTLIIMDFIGLLTVIGFYAAIGMVLIGLVMKLFNKFLNHPEYARWSKSLFVLSGVVVALTAIVPKVLQNI